MLAEWALSGEFEKNKIRESIIDCSKSFYGSSNVPTAQKGLQNEYVVALCVMSQYEKKLIYRDKNSFLPEPNDVCLQHLHSILGESITLLHQPRRGAALTWCEHANGLTSTATPGCHTHTYTAYTDTHRGESRQTDIWHKNKMPTKTKAAVSAAVSIIPTTSFHWATIRPLLNSNWGKICLFHSSTHKQSRSTQGAQTS